MHAACPRGHYKLQQFSGAQYSFAAIRTLGCGQPAATSMDRLIEQLRRVIGGIIGSSLAAIWAAR